MNVSVRIRTGERRKAAILAGSLLLHVLLLAWLALPGPPLLERIIADDLPTMTVELERPIPPETARPRESTETAPPAPAPPFQVRQPLRPAPAGVPTLNVAPTAPNGRPGTAVHPGPLPGSGAGDLRTALRGSSAGCANAQAVGLNRREQEKCDERFGAAKPRGSYAGPLDAAKARQFESQAIAQDLARQAWQGSMGPGVDHRSREHPGTMKEIPFVLGAEQDGLGRPMNEQQQRIKHLQDLDKADAREKQRSRENDQR